MKLKKEDITKKNVIRSLCNLALEGKIEILDMLVRSAKFTDQPYIGNKKLSKKECQDSQNNFFGFKLN